MLFGGGTRDSSRPQYIPTCPPPPDVVVVTYRLRQAPATSPLNDDDGGDDGGDDGDDGIHPQRQRDAFELSSRNP